jgi:membrane protein implicated in regulation of membrane protease activity
VSGNPRLLLWFTLGTAVVVGAIVALAVDKWWVLLIAVGIHLGVSALVATGIFKRLDEGDKPDPVTEAELEDKGRPVGS